MTKKTALDRQLKKQVPQLQNKWHKLIGRELACLESYLVEAINSEDALIQSSALGLIEAGGKRIRPAFAYLSACIWGGSLDELLPLLAALELIHTGSLVHDDIIDKAAMRRGRPTVSFVHGDAAALYVGDYLIGRALELVSVYQNERVDLSLNRTVLQMCVGELRQERDFFRLEQSYRDYFHRIARKTALLFAGSCECGAELAGAGEENVDSMRRFGYNLGMAFQIIDDMLDLAADEEQLGKPTGNDLKQGNLSLPVLYALKESDAADKLTARILSLQAGDMSAVSQALLLVRNSGGLQFAAEIANRYLDRAAAELKFWQDCREKKILADAMEDFRRQTEKLTAKKATAK
jgi:heptaprenyl diphosphate synthase